MIVKSKGHKYLGSIRKLVHYILDDKKTHNASFFLTRYITGDKTAESVITQMEANEQKRRIERRKNSVVTYHDIISFEKRDTKKLDERLLRKLTRKYSKLRSDNSIMVSALHTDQEHIHLHILLSACQLDGTSSRISREEFKQCKIEIEKWQDQHLKLEYSRINHDAKKKCSDTLVNTTLIKEGNKAIKES